MNIQLVRIAQTILNPKINNTTEAHRIAEEIVNFALANWDEVSFSYNNLNDDFDIIYEYTRDFVRDGGLEVI